MEREKAAVLGESVGKEKYEKPTIKTYTEEEVLKEYQACGITF
jgi:hypothetical protein